MIDLRSWFIPLTRRTAFGLALREGAETSATAIRPCEAVGFEGCEFWENSELKGL
jgi:hypothetical protein